MPLSQTLTAKEQTREFVTPIKICMLIRRIQVQLENQMGTNKLRKSRIVLLIRFRKKNRALQKLKLIIGSPKAN